ncbi:MAG: cell division protein FtsQ/DivIB [Candidatus Thiodiazotropha sp. (ex Lucinoma borealis)]|nr:cell division protein FtsQ/DivIB [Candidatus Thiodiazotropha sp. (ex Lucinoma borealis)]MCU7870443.1 cell division protein FtsQ/DivIB [Candidatus Thiodiazotropha sp. (ex Lucinoma borealis)]
MKRPANKSQQQSDRRSLHDRAWLIPLLIITITTGLIGWGIFKIQDPTVMPVRVVGVDGEIQYMKKEGLERVVAQAVNGSFFSIDLMKMRNKVEQLPWVESASIRRVWPDTLRVKVVEQVPLAYWGEDAMVNRQGVVFKPDVLPQLPDLVTLVGEESSASNITRDYLRMHTLLGTVGLELKHVWVDARQAWRIKTGDGLLLQLGRRDVMPRLSRFVQLYPFLMNQAGKELEIVDLRYTNGFSVHWQLPTEQQAQMESPSYVARIAGK